LLVDHEQPAIEDGVYPYCYLLQGDTIMDTASTQVTTKLSGMAIPEYVRSIIKLAEFTRGVPYSGTFFVVPLGAQSLILGMPYLERENPAIDWQAKTLVPQSNPLPPTPPSTPESPPVLLNPLDSHPKCHLPRILSIRQINPKRDELLLFTIANVTDYKEALATAINFDSDDVPSESVSTTTTATTTPSAFIPVEYTEFANVFKDKEISQLPLHRLSVDHKIPFAPGSKPFYGPIYNLCESELRYLKDYIDQMLERGWICLSESLFSSRILFVKRADGSLYRYVDYRRLNAMIVKNRYFLPLISELID